jgi:hypothetical protein
MTDTARVPETPQEVYEKLNGTPVEFLYRVDRCEVVRVRLVSRGRNGWTRIEYASGEQKNVQRNSAYPDSAGWSGCPFQACELAVANVCALYARRPDGTSELFVALKKSIDLLESFDPASFGEWPNPVD